MKIYILSLLSVMTILSCKKDNYDEPSVTLSGRITYQGEPINVSSKDVNLELWEPGWGKNGAINVNINEDGSYSTILFNGTYKLIIPPSQGPFRSVINSTTKNDTMPLTINGNTTLDIEVMPYYMIRNAKLALSAGNINASLQLEKIITDVNARDIENVFLYLNQTTIVNGTNYIARTTLAGSAITDPSNIALTVAVPASLSSNGTTGDQSYVYARIGVKISGVEDLLFSTVEKIDL